MSALQERTPGSAALAQYQSQEFMLAGKVWRASLGNQICAEAWLIVHDTRRAKAAAAKVILPIPRWPLRNPGASIQLRLHPLNGAQEVAG
jgi:hypothetical protein